MAGLEIGTNRVATIRSSTGTVRRSFSKICSLPKKVADSLMAKFFKAGDMFRPNCPVEALQRKPVGNVTCTTDINGEKLKAGL